ncbi:MAG: hypothetical protein H6741_19690 [Alphaproteobacteria bacterium]|nr:hypothetical protein [Alphaproteobacteria bacterium]MCB9794928.1 hypothetical protein [Alphaproteobacteria bacterium]
MGFNMGLWDRLLDAGRRLLGGDAEAPKPASKLPSTSSAPLPGASSSLSVSPPPPPPRPHSKLAETVDFEVDALEEIELDEPTSEIERAPPPPPPLRTLGVGGLSAPRREPPRGVLGSLDQAEPTVPALPPSASGQRYAELFGESTPYAPGPFEPEAWDDEDEDEDLRPTVIDHERYEDAFEPELTDLNDLTDLAVNERGLTDPLAPSELDEERDTQADWLGPTGAEPLDVNVEALIDVEALVEVDDEEPPRRNRRPPTDLTHLTAMPVLEERTWEPGRPPTSHAELGEVDLESEEAPIGVGALEPEIEPMDEILAMEREDEAATIDEDLFPQPEVTAPTSAPRPPQTKPMPKLLGSPGRVMSASDFLFDFAVPQSGRAQALKAPEPPPEVPEIEEAAIELTEPGERRFPNSLGLSDKEVMEHLRTEQFPDLAHLDSELLARLCRLEADILERATELGESVCRLVTEIAPRSGLWQGAVWWSGVVGDSEVRVALGEASNGGGDPSRAHLAWCAWPYLHELLSASGAAEDEMELGLRLARLERSIAQRRTVIRMGPPELRPELDRFPTEPRGLNALPGFEWLAH